MSGSAALVLLVPDGHPVKRSNPHKEDSETEEELTHIDHVFHVCLPFACRTCKEPKR